MLQKQAALQRARTQASCGSIFRRPSGLPAFDASQGIIDGQGLLSDSHTRVPKLAHSLCGQTQRRARTISIEIDAFARTAHRPMPGLLSAIARPLFEQVTRQEMAAALAGLEAGARAPRAARASKTNAIRRRPSRLPHIQARRWRAHEQGLGRDSIATLPKLAHRHCGQSGPESARLPPRQGRFTHKVNPAQAGLSEWERPGSGAGPRPGSWTPKPGMRDAGGTCSALLSASLYWAGPSILTGPEPGL